MREERGRKEESEQIKKHFMKLKAFRRAREMSVLYNTRAVFFFPSFKEMRMRMTMVMAGREI
jgi:hypothetical protein